MLLWLSASDQANFLVPHVSLLYIWIVRKRSRYFMICRCGFKHLPGGSSALAARAPGSLTFTSLLLLDLDADFDARDMAVTAAAAKPFFTLSSSTSKIDKVCTWFATKVSRKVARLSMRRWWSRWDWELVRLRDNRSGAVDGLLGWR